jgi:four helix bundle protein
MKAAVATGVGHASGFRRVIARQKAGDLLAAVYRVADHIPHRDYWLRSQILGAARSVSSNIAEGHGRGAVRDYVRFLEMASSSLNEVENDLHILKRNHIVSSSLADDVEPLRIEAGRVLTGLLRVMRGKVQGNSGWQRRQVGEDRGIYFAGQDWDPENDDVDSLASGSQLLAPGGTPWLRARKVA